MPGSRAYPLPVEAASGAGLPSAPEVIPARREEAAPPRLPAVAGPVSREQSRQRWVEDVLGGKRERARVVGLPVHSGGRCDALEPPPAPAHCLQTWCVAPALDVAHVHAIKTTARLASMARSSAITPRARRWVWGTARTPCTLWTMPRPRPPTAFRRPRWVLGGCGGNGAATRGWRLAVPVWIAGCLQAVGRRMGRSSVRPLRRAAAGRRGAIRCRGPLFRSSHPRVVPRRRRCSRARTSRTATAATRGSSCRPGRATIAAVEKTLVLGRMDERVGLRSACLAAWRTGQAGSLTWRTGQAGPRPGRDPMQLARTSRAALPRGARGSLDSFAGTTAWQAGPPSDQPRRAIKPPVCACRPLGPRDVLE